MNRFLVLGFLLLASLPAPLAGAERPNVLFIAVDDLNHWVTHLGRNPQARTPNIDRLAKMGVTFRNAHCAAPACEPSRCALMSGRRPWTSGCYPITTHGRGNHGIRTERHRYIRYANGEEELYDSVADPDEWKNLAKNPETQDLRAKLAKWLPTMERPAQKKKKGPRKR